MGDLAGLVARGWLGGGSGFACHGGPMYHEPPTIPPYKQPKPNETNQRVWDNTKRIANWKCRRKAYCCCMVVRLVYRRYQNWVTCILFPVGRESLPAAAPSVYYIYIIYILYYYIYIVLPVIPGRFFIVNTFDFMRKWVIGFMGRLLVLVGRRWGVCCSNGQNNVHFTKHDF